MMLHIAWAYLCQLRTVHFYLGFSDGPKTYPSKCLESALMTLLEAECLSALMLLVGWQEGHPA